MMVTRPCVYQHIHHSRFWLDATGNVIGVEEPAHIVYTSCDQVVLELCRAWLNKYV